MDRTELKNWAKGKIKGHVGELFVALLIAGLLTNLTIGGGISQEGSQIKFNTGIPLGLLFYFVEVGLVYYMIKFLKDEKRELKDLFKYSNDFGRIFLTGLLQSLMTFLWALLLIIPGIIKGIAYSLVPFILADEKYKDLGFMDTLKKSEEMMMGHKMDYFVLGLSFIGWHILAICTIGLLEIWIIPYQTTAMYKFLNDLKTDYEKSSK